MRFIDMSYLISLLALSLSILLTLYRLIKGPNFEDRILALDLIATTGIVLVAVFSMYTGDQTILDIAILMAIMAFLTTIAFAYYLERKRKFELKREESK